MKLTLQGLQDTKAWEEAGIALPSYDPALIARNTRQTPVWAHFGIGNIFRVFLGTIADQLLAEGKLTSGITCVETFDMDVVDRIYDPCYEVTIVKRRFQEISVSVQATFVFLWQRLERALI